MATAKILVEIRLRKSLPTTLKAHELSLLGVVGDKLSLAIVSSALNQFAIQASMILSTLPSTTLADFSRARPLLPLKTPQRAYFVALHRVDTWRAVLRPTDV
jgi:hypothetical protein